MEDQVFQLSFVFIEVETLQVFIGKIITNKTLMH